VVSQIDGPVLLVGHPHAGAFIGNGETLAANEEFARAVIDVDHF
jgi:hypothetical protein